MIPRFIRDKKQRVISPGAKVLVHATLVGAALLSAPPSLRSQDTHFVFQHISVGEGLSSEAVRCIYQDSVGYLWFGTLGGIDRYDGYSFTTYKHDPDDTASLVNAFVNTLCEDRVGNLWVGTYAGQDRLDRASGTFTHYLPHPSDLYSDQGNFVNATVLSAKTPTANKLSTPHDTKPVVSPNDSDSKPISSGLSVLPGSLPAPATPFVAPNSLLEMRAERWKSVVDGG